MFLKKKILHILLKYDECVCRTSENCKSLVLQEKCNNEIILSPDKVIRYLLKPYTLEIYFDIFLAPKRGRILYYLHSRSDMSAHVLLNLLNEMRKRDKKRSLSIILCLFRNKFNDLNHTGASMIDSIYHMTLRLLKNLISRVNK